MDWQLVSQLLSSVWNNPDDVLFKDFNVSLYPEVNKEIPDDEISIQGIYSLEEIKELELEPFFMDLNIVPFLITYGDPLFCVGIGNDNKGNIYYFDMDFGCFDLKENLNAFIQKLQL